MSYGVIGPYSRKGYWFVSKNGSSALVRGDRLPKEGQGYQFYYLGGKKWQVEQRWGKAVGALGFDVGNVQLEPEFWKEASSKGVSANVTNPGGFNFVDALGYGLAGVAGTAALAGKAAVAGGEAAAGGAAGSAESGAAGGAAGGAASGAGKGLAESAVKDAGITAAIAAFISAYGIRALEVIGGAALILFGLMVVAKKGDMKMPSAVPVPV